MYFERDIGSSKHLTYRKTVLSRGLYFYILNMIIKYNNNIVNLELIFYAKQCFCQLKKIIV